VAEVRLNAQARTEFGKGGARRTRRAGLIPAVIYGHGADPRHIDLLTVRRGEKITIDVPLHLVGEVVRGGLLAQESTTVSLEAEATNLPSAIEIDIAELEIGAQIKASDLTLPSGSTLAGDPEQILLIVHEAPSEAEMAAEGEGEHAEAPAAEGESGEAGEGDAGSGGSEPAADAG
jgi:large subunit ribosomal protein L25